MTETPLRQGNRGASRIRTWRAGHRRMGAHVLRDLQHAVLKGAVGVEFGAMPRGVAIPPGLSTRRIRRTRPAGRICPWLHVAKTCFADNANFFVGQA